jgi:hypothetical protein
MPHSVHDFFSSRIPLQFLRLLCRTRSASQKMAPKKKNPTASMILAVGFEKIARLVIRNLDRQPPGARRHTRTAGTTITSLRGHLDVALHKMRNRSRENYRCQI